MKGHCSIWRATKITCTKRRRSSKKLWVCFILRLYENFVNSRRRSHCITHKRSTGTNEVPRMLYQRSAPDYAVSSNDWASCYWTVDCEFVDWLINQNNQSRSTTNTPSPWARQSAYQSINFITTRITSPTLKSTILTVSLRKTPKDVILMRIFHFRPDWGTVLVGYCSFESQTGFRSTFRHDGNENRAWTFTAQFYVWGHECKRNWDELCSHFHYSTFERHEDESLCEKMNTFWIKDIILSYVLW